MPDTSRGLAWCGEDAGRRAGAGTELDLMGSGGACWVAWCHTLCSGYNVT